MRTHRQSPHRGLAVQAGVVFSSLFFAAPINAETRIIAVTGEYRMGDNDTRTDAKRLALMDAKRLALEETGTYLESITEVRSLQLSRDELHAYTAGIVEVVEQTTKDSMEDATHVVRVQVRAKVDTAVIARSIDRLRRNEQLKAELLRSMEESDRLRRERDGLRQKLAAAKTGAEIEAFREKRQKLLTAIDVNDLITRAFVAIGGTASHLSIGSSTASGRMRARSLLEQAKSLAPDNLKVHKAMISLLLEEEDYDGAIALIRTIGSLDGDPSDVYGSVGFVLVLKGDLDGALAELRNAVRLNPSNVDDHVLLGDVLAQKNDLDGALAEFRTAEKLKPDFGEIHNHMGGVFERKGDLISALSEFQVALRIDPLNKNAKSNIHRIKRLLGEKAAAK